MLADKAKGRIVHSRTSINGIYGKLSRITLYVKNSSDNRRAFSRLMKREYGIDIATNCDDRGLFPIQVIGQFLVYDVEHTYETIVDIQDGIDNHGSAFNCCDKWEYALSSHVPYRSFGSGTEKIKPSNRFGFSTSHREVLESQQSAAANVRERREENRVKRLCAKRTDYYVI